MTDSQTIKYRLIGALVILTSLLLAWWLFLDHDVKRYQETKRSIPAPMPIERFDVAQPTPVDNVQAQQVRQHIAQLDEPATTKAAAQTEPEKTTTDVSQTVTAKPQNTRYVQHDAQGMPEAWVVQVASFSNQDNAKSFQQRLLAAKLPAYVKRFKLAEGERFRVLIGPKLEKAKAEALLPQLKKDFQVQGQLLRYQAGFEE